MSDAVWLAIIAASGPIVTNIVTHLLTYLRDRRADEKLDHITELSNSMLSKTAEKKDELAKELDQTKHDALTEAKIKLAEAEKTIALLTTPKKEEGPRQS